MHQPPTLDVLVYDVIDHVVADEWIVRGDPDDYVDTKVAGRIGGPRQHILFASAVYTDR